jgi:hypothetical protein
MTETAAPHLIDTESVRSEAATQYGGLGDAAALVQAWRSTIDPNVEATMLKKVNVDETQALADELDEAEEGEKTTVHRKLEAALGPDHGIVEVLGAAVRGHGLSVVGTDARGRPVKLVVPWDDKFKSIGVSPAERAARENAKTESSLVQLGQDARAEIERRVAAARDEIMTEVSKLFAKKSAKVTEARDAALEEIAADDEDTGADDGDGDGDGDGGDGTSAAGWPKQHDALDALGKEHGVEFGARDNVATKIEKIEAAGVTPPASD